MKGQLFDMNRNSTGRIPEIYCAIALIFEDNINIFQVIDLIKEKGVPIHKISRPKYASEISIDVAAIVNKHFWSLEEAMTEMFSQVEGRLEDIKNITANHGGHILIDIAFYHHKTYPALTFSGENMKKIHYLDAGISIDPY